LVLKKTKKSKKGVDFEEYHRVCTLKDTAEFINQKVAPEMLTCVERVAHDKLTGPISSKLRYKLVPSAVHKAINSQDFRDRTVEAFIKHYDPKETWGAAYKSKAKERVTSYVGNLRGGLSTRSTLFGLCHGHL
jgi:hypothetical protein